MKVCILMGSPRKQGNTNALLVPFRQELEALGAETETVWLYDLDIRPCTACRACQRDWTVFGCAQRDDVPAIFDRVLACDLFEEGMRRYCKHSRLRYLGSHAERHLGYDVPFMDGEKEARTRTFARELWRAAQSN